MENRTEKIEANEYGNVSFGEASRLLIDIIGKNVILRTLKKNERKSFERFIERVYKDQQNYQELALAEVESPQWYADQFFKHELEGEKNYDFPAIAMLIFKSFTEQFFYAIRNVTPFEKTKKETALYVIQRYAYNIFYHSLRERHPDDTSGYKISPESIIAFFADSYDNIFSEIESDIYKEFDTPQKKNIKNWRKGKFHNNATWQTLKPVLTILKNSGKNDSVNRLIKLYLRKNAQRAIEEILKIFEEEQVQLIVDVLEMFRAKKRPEELFCDNILKVKMEAINKCLPYHHIINFDLEKSDEMINVIEDICSISKSFFSPWLKARAKVIKMGESLKKEENREVKNQIINGYKKAFVDGSRFAGKYLQLFLLEAITVNKYMRRKSKDYFGYGYALDYFEKNDKDNMIYKINNNDIRDLGKKILSFELPSSNNVDSTDDYPAIYIVDVYLSLAFSHMENGKFEDAIMNFTRVIDKEPNFVEAYIYRGMAYMNKGEYGKARDNYLLALKIEPNNLQILNNLREIENK